MPSSSSYCKLNYDTYITFLHYWKLFHRCSDISNGGTGQTGKRVGMEEREKRETETAQLRRLIVSTRAVYALCQFINKDDVMKMIEKNYKDTIQDHKTLGVKECDTKEKGMALFRYPFSWRLMKNISVCHFSRGKL